MSAYLKLASTGAVIALLAAPAVVANFEVKMLNQGAHSGAMGKPSQII